MICYEYPFNESIRTMLRLEQLLQRAGQLVSRDTALDHHIALATMFEIIDVAARADLKSDLLQDLERQRKLLSSYRGNPAISEAALEAALAQVDGAAQALVALTGKAGQALTTNEWLTSIRSRIAIPGGTCSFDLPGYHAWQHLPAARRQADLLRWLNTLEPLGRALQVSLGLLRESGQPTRVLANGGRYQQSLSSQRGVQLARVHIDEALGCYPEISGNRLLLSVRLMRADTEGHAEAYARDLSFELSLCG